MSYEPNELPLLYVAPQIYVVLTNYTNNYTNFDLYKKNLIISAAMPATSTKPTSHGPAPAGNSAVDTTSYSPYDTKIDILKASDNDYVIVYHASTKPLENIKPSDKSNYKFAQKGYVYVATNPLNATGYVRQVGKTPYLYKITIKKSELLPDTGMIKTYGGKNTLNDSINLYGLARIKRMLYGNEIELIDFNYEEGGITEAKSLNTYAARTQENFKHMDAPPEEWSAIEIIGFQETDVNGKIKKMPLFKFPVGYQQAPTLFPMNTTGDYNCELCSRNKITTVYHIKNDTKKWTLRVGSECVTHFGPGTSGKENERTFKIQSAKMLDHDLVKLKTFIYKTFSRKVAIGWGKTQREWKSFYIGKGQSSDYFIHKSSGIEAINPVLLFEKNKITDNLKWYYVFNAMPAFFYEDEAASERRQSKEPDFSYIDKRLLSWFTRVGPLATDFLRQLLAVLNLYKDDLPADADISSEYLQALKIPDEENETFADGGPVGLNGFEIEQITIKLKNKYLAKG